MSQYKHPITGHVQIAHNETVGRFLTSRGYVLDDPAADLRGADLDAALDAAGLPKSGRADEKRARLAEHRDTGNSTGTHMQFNAGGFVPGPITKTTDGPTEVTGPPALDRNLPAPPKNPSQTTSTTPEGA